MRDSIYSVDLGGMREGIRYIQSELTIESSVGIGFSELLTEFWIDNYNVFTCMQTAYMELGECWNSFQGHCANLEEDYHYDDQN